jgi:hypothetical protein
MLSTKRKHKKNGGSGGFAVVFVPGAAEAQPVIVKGYSLTDAVGINDADEIAANGTHGPSTVTHALLLILESHSFQPAFEQPAAYLRSFSYQERSLDFNCREVQWVWWLALGVCISLRVLSCAMRTFLILLALACMARAYTVLDLGELGTQGSTATAINSRGDIVGSSIGRRQITCFPRASRHPHARSRSRGSVGS